jgi:hypothetical protein
MSSDYYAEWVERHKHEDNDGHWWIEHHGVLTDGPYGTEEEIDKVLWNQALDGDALPSPP